MANRQEESLAVKVAAEALRAGDRESIGDAQVGLSARGLEGHVVFQQLAVAAGVLDPVRALDDAPGEAAVVALLVELWKRRQFAALAHGLTLLGLKTTEADAARLSDALTASNGRRRTELLSPADVLTVVLEVRHGASTARRPAEDRGWRQRATTRTVCVLTRAEGKLTLELGTEETRSYVDSQRLTTACSLTVDEAPAAPQPERAVETAGEVALRTRFTELLSGEPSEPRFERVLNAVAELEDAQVDAAGALIDRHLSLWPDRLRALHWRFSPEQLTPRIRPLVRALTTTLENLVGFAARAPIAEVRELALIDGAYRPALDDPLAAFPSLHTLRLWCAEDPSLVPRLRLPRTLERLQVLRATEDFSALTTETLTALVKQVAEQSPSLARLDVGVGDLSPLQQLPSSVSLGVFTLHREGDAARVASTLGGRPLAELSLSTTSWDGAAEVHRAGLPARVARLRLDTAPGGLAAMLEGAAWGALRGLSVTLPARNARFYRRKPHEYSFTKADVAALASAGFLSQLDELELTGMVGEDLAETLVNALARAKPRLTRLSLNCAELGNDALGVLADAGLLKDLEVLELYRCRLKAKGFTLLLGAQGPTRLTRLVLAKNAATAPSISSLAAWPGLSSVARLDLREVTLSAEQRATLAASPYLRPEALDLTDDDFW